MRYAGDSDAFTNAFTGISNFNQSIAGEIAAQGLQAAGRKKAAEEMMRFRGGGGGGWQNLVGPVANIAKSLLPGGGLGGLSAKAGDLGSKAFSSGFGGSDLVGKAFSGLDLGY